jgi:hypothetical protein
MSGHHRVGRQHRGAEVALEHLADVDVELLVQRLVQPQFQARTCYHVGRRAVAHDGQHRVDRDHAADEKRHREQAQVGEQNHHQEVAEAFGVRRQALARRARGYRTERCHAGGGGVGDGQSRRAISAWTR